MPVLPQKTVLASLLLLFAAATALSTAAFRVSSPAALSPSLTRATTALRMADAVPGASAQAEYGKSLKLPSTYARCGRCESAYALKEEDLGNGRGRRLECSVCGHTWYQARDKLMTINEGFELIDLPETDAERVARNIEEGKSPKFTGAMKLYVGNIAFSCTEEDVYQAFNDVGTVGEVALIRDENGRNRGFAFVTMRTKGDGQKAVEELDGTQLHGRTLAVRPSNT